MLRAVPATLRMQASMVAALVSGNLISAILRSCCWVSLPIFLRLGSGEPEPGFLAMDRPSSFLMSTEVGGVLVMKVKERS